MTHCYYSLTKTTMDFRCQFFLTLPKNQGTCVFLFWWKLRWKEAPGWRQHVWLNRYMAEKKWSVLHRTFCKSKMCSAASRADQELSSPGDRQHQPLEEQCWDLYPPQLYPFVIQPREISNSTPLNSDMSHLILNQVECNVPCSRAQPRGAVCVPCSAHSPGGSVPWWGSHRAGTVSWAAMQDGTSTVCSIATC